MNKKTTIAIAILFIILAAIAGGWFLFAQQPKPAANIQNPAVISGNTATTAATTTLPDQAAGWIVYSTSSEKTTFTFKYPPNFGANVWKPTQWPPKVTLVPKGQDPVAAGCPNLRSETGAVMTGNQGTTTNGTGYSLYEGSDIGAGQLYSEYCYVLEGGQNYSAVIDFIIQSHSACGFDGCGAYCGTQYEDECTNLSREKDIEGPIQQAVDTAMFGAAPARTPKERKLPAAE
jgi:hypothetical protein